MAWILNIDTSTRNCTVSLAKSGKLIACKESSLQNAHASLLPEFIQAVLKEGNISFSQLDAVAIGKGPGSFTGLRIGSSSAKGICYALNIPLIAVTSLEILALGFDKSLLQCRETLLLPMMDARRMEVYTASYDIKMNLKNEIRPAILDHTFIENLPKSDQYFYFGDGAEKAKQLFADQDCFHYFDHPYPSARNMTEVSLEKFNNRSFENLIGFEPFYLKDFIPGTPKVKGLS